MENGILIWVPLDDSEKSADSKQHTSRNYILSEVGQNDYLDRLLVTMTRTSKSKLTKQPKPRRQVSGSRQLGHWLLQDAKARFSELVRRVRSEGPQHVTVHGRDEVVVIAAEEFRRLKGDLTGQALIAAMQASPHRDIDIEPRRVRMPVRDVAL